MCSLYNYIDIMSIEKARSAKNLQYTDRYSKNLQYTDRYSKNPIINNLIKVKLESEIGVVKENFSQILKR